MSDMRIKVISVEVTNRGKFDQAEVTYKNLSFQEKVEAKKVMSFVNKDVFETLKASKSGDEYTIKREKDDKGYWQWIGISSGGQSSASSSTSSSPGKAVATPAPKSTYETPEERAKKQVYIIRQSSITSAINLLKTDKKAPSVEEVLGVAKCFEDYVFGINLDADSVTKLPEFDPDEDIPM